MRRHGSRFPPLVNPFDEFNGPNGGAAIQALIDATPINGTLYLPNRIYTLQTLVFKQPITVVVPDAGTKIYGSLAVRPRPLTVDDPGYRQIGSGVRSQVQVIDLRQNQIYSWGPVLPFTDPTYDWQGGFQQVVMGLPALMCNGSQLELTRWPTPSAVGVPWEFSSLNMTAIDNSHFTDSALPVWSAANWAGKNRFAVTLYPYYYLSEPSESEDYYTSATLTGADEVILDWAIPDTTTPPGSDFDGPYGPLQSNTRYAVQNVLEQLLYPGQQYIDVNNLLFYFIPPDDGAAHYYRVSWATVPLLELSGDSDGGCSGISFVGGPLAFYGSRSNATTANFDLGSVKFDNIQAFGIGMDAFFFESQVQSTDWSIAVLVVDWCGGAALRFGPSGGTPPTTLDPWNCSFGSIYISRTSQWCRTFRGGLHFTCVGCTVGFVTSLGNPNHHLLHDSHDFTINGGYFDGSFTEGGDVGVVYGGSDPTTFGTVFNNFTIVGIPNMTYFRSGASNGRRGIYLDNGASGTTINNFVFVNCDSLDAFSNPDYCVYINGGQANTVNGITTIGCGSAPVFISNFYESPTGPWEAPSGQARMFFREANSADPRYQTKYGSNWSELINDATDDPLGAPRNNRVLNVWPQTGSASQADLTNLYAPVTIYQPQGPVAATAAPAPPLQPPGAT